MTEITRADFDSAVTRMEHGEATDEDYNLVCAYVHRLGWRIGDDCLDRQDCYADCLTAAPASPDDLALCG